MMKGIVLAISLVFASFTVSAGQPIDINKADAATIAKEVNGIGPAKAKAIVKYRDTNGPYRSVDELVEVAGIGEKTLEKIRPYVKVMPKQK